MSRHDSSDDNMALMRQLWELFLMYLILLLGATFTIALWLTRGLYHLINFITAGALERLDGLVVIVAGLLWGSIAVAALPLFLNQGAPYEESLLSLAVVGNLFGWCVGFLVVFEMWDSARTPSATTPSFIESLHLPASHYQHKPLPAVTPDTGLSLKELEELFKNSNASNATAVSG